MRQPRLKFNVTVGIVLLAAVTFIFFLRWRIWSEGDVLAEFTARPVTEYDLGERFLVRRVPRDSSPFAMVLQTSDFMYVCEVRKGRFLMGAYGFMAESYWEKNASARWANASELAQAKLQPDRNHEDANSHAFFSIGNEYRIVYLRRWGEERWVRVP